VSPNVSAAPWWTVSIGLEGAVAGAVSPSVPALRGAERRAMRLFVAVRPPEGSVPEVRDPHVTLCFLGEVADDRLGDVVDALGQAAAGAGACDATIEPGPLRRLAAGAVVRPVSGLDDLARTVRAAVGAYAARPETRRFRGHLTVARRRRGEPVPGGGQSPAEAVRWRVEEVVLVRSELGRGPGGSARHTAVAVVALGGSGSV
jgi:2'-5' RNA ligase